MVDEAPVETGFLKFYTGGKVIVRFQAAGGYRSVAEGCIYRSLKVWAKIDYDFFRQKMKEENVPEEYIDDIIEKMNMYDETYLERNRYDF